MSWLPVASAPIAHFAAAPRAPSLRIFTGKPHALAFLADGSLVVGASHGIALHDPSAPMPARASVDVRGVSWMVAHPDGESVVAVVRAPRGRAVARVWPATGRVVELQAGEEFVGYFCGALSPDGARLVWLRGGPPSALCSVDVATGAALGEIALPSDASGARSLAVRRDGAVYLGGEAVLVVRPDGRVEPCEGRAFFGDPHPFFADEHGGMLCTGGERIALVDGRFERQDDLPKRALGGTIAHDRSRLTFYYPLGPLQVWDVGEQRVIFSFEQDGGVGQIPNWWGQSAAASATHVAAIDHATAEVAIWRIDQPGRPLARLTGYSLGARRLMLHGDAITVHTCQPTNSLDAVLEIDLASGAAKMLQRSEVYDVARTADGQRLLVLHKQRALQPLLVTHFDAAGEPLESFEVQRGAGELALAPGGATWGVTSHTYPADRRAEPICHAQWRAFGATKWAKSLKLKGRWPRVVLSDAAAAVSAGKELAVVGLAKGKTLLSLQLPTVALALAISRDGAYVGVLGVDRPRLIRVATGAVFELPASLHGEPTAHRCACFDDDGRWLFVGHPAGAIVQHRVPDGEPVATLHGHADKVCALAWSGGALWSGSEDGTIVRWGELG